MAEGGEPNPALGTSWILELRNRLRSCGRQLPEPGSRVVFFVPLFVAQGQLQTLLTQGDAGDAGALAPVGFPAREASATSDPWTIAAAAATEFLDLAPSQILRLGLLDERRGLGEIRYQACVGAIPRPQQQPPLEVELFELPLLAALSPQSVELRRLEVLGTIHDVLVAQVEGRQLWGPASEVLDDLLAQLGLGT